MIEDDEMPRRRRGAKAVAVEAEEERGLAMRILLHSPKDMLAAALAVAAIGAILTNALVPAGRPSSVADVRLVGRDAAGAGRSPARCRVRARSNSPRVREPALFEPKPVEIRSAEPKAVDPKAS